MNCDRCPYDARNGGTQDQRQAHCITCDFTDVYPKPYYPLHDPRTDRLIEEACYGYRDDQGPGADFDCPDCPDCPECPDNADGADEAAAPASAELMDRVMQSEFVTRFSQLQWRDQAVLLGILKHGDCTQCVADMTRFAVSTVWEHRRRLEADDYWGQWIRHSGTKLHKRRRGKPAIRSPRKSHDCNGRLRETGPAKAAHPEKGAIRKSGSPKNGLPEKPRPDNGRHFDGATIAQP